MPFEVQCHRCGAEFRAPDRLAGKQVACAKCHAPLRVGAVAAGKPAVYPKGVARRKQNVCVAKLGTFTKEGSIPLNTNVLKFNVTPKRRGTRSYPFNPVNVPTEGVTMRKLIVAAALVLLSGCSDKPSEGEIKNLLMEKMQSSRLMIDEETGIDIGIDFDEFFALENFQVVNGIRHDDNTYVAEVTYDLVLRMNKKEILQELIEHERAKGQELPEISAKMKYALLIALLLRFREIQAGKSLTTELEITLTRTDKGWQIDKERMNDRLEELARGTPTAAALCPPSQVPHTPLWIRVPQVFKQGFAPGAMVDGKPVNVRRIQPPVTVPGLKATWEGHVEKEGSKLPFYCYLAVSDKDPTAAIQNQLKQMYQDLEVNWSPYKDPAGKTWKKWRGKMDQDWLPLDGAGNDMPTRAMPGMLEFDCRQEGNLWVIVGWRVPSSIEGEAALDGVIGPTLGSLERR